MSGWDWVDAPFVIDLQVQAEDIDGLGHANNAVYVSWLERCAWRHSQSLGLDLAEYRRLDRAMAVLRHDHALAGVDRLSLEQLAAEPLISYHPSFTGRRRIDRAFEQRELTPTIALEAIDSDVIKTYVRTGLGVGLVAEMAAKDEPPGSELVFKPVSHLFGHNTTRVAFRKGAYLRGYVLTFAELLSDRLSRHLIERAMAGAGDSYEL